MNLHLKQYLPRTLFGRSLMILILPLVLVQAITVYMFFDRHWEKMTGRMAYAVAGEIALVISSGNETSGFSSISGHAARNLGLLVSYLPGKTLEQIESRPLSWRQKFIARLLSRELNTQVRRPFSVLVDPREKWVDVRIQLNDGILLVSLPQRRLFSTSGYIVLLWMFGSSLILLTVSVLFMRNQIRPIRKLAVVAERFGKGQDAPFSFKPEGAWEIRQAGRAFLDMQERLKRQIGQRTAMLSGISHDLRTPLTRMKLQLSMMPASADAKALRSDIDAMEKMVNAYLSFARGEEGEQPVSTDIAALLRKSTETSQQQGPSIELKTVDGIFIMLRPAAFARCLDNLLGNARKYAKNVWVELLRIENHIEIVIDDDGPGIPENMREEVFKPFVRVDPSRNPETGGIGLGLPIAQDIVHSHGGTIKLGNSQKGGLRVVVSLPL